MVKELIQSLRTFGVFSERKLWLGITYSIIASALALPVTFLIREMFDIALPAADFMLLVKLGLAAIALLVLSGVLSIYARNAVLRVTKVAMFQIRTTVMNRLLHSSHEYYVQTDISRFHKIAVYDTEKISALLNSFFSIILPAVIVSLALVGVLFFINWQMSTVFIALVLISFWIINLLRKAGKERLSQFQNVFSVFHQHTLFVLEYYSLIKAASNQPGELTRHNKILNELNHSNLRMTEGFTRLSNLQELLFSISSIILLILGGYQVIHHLSSLGALLSFYFCLYLLRRYYNNVNGSLQHVLEGHYSLGEYQGLVQTIFNEPYSGSKKIRIDGNINVNAISFSFPSKRLFHLFSLQLEPGRVTLLMGPNGSGKSTLIHLILGFLKPQEGQLFVEHVPYEDVDIRYLRTQISVLFQESFIFNGTILENILYGRAGVDKKELSEAIRSASLEEFIQSLPEGEQTQVGERGIKLSGGQRQKLALARCFLSKAPVIIMDEPTNHLDRKTIATFIDTVKNIKHKPSLLLVSHDTQLSALADMICEL